MGGSRGHTYSHGMDVAAVRDIARRLAQAQRDLEDAKKASDTAVRLLHQHWGGEDSAGFSTRWPQLRERLETQASDLESLARRMREQADEQDKVSGVGGGEPDEGKPGSPWRPGGTRNNGPDGGGDGQGGDGQGGDDAGVGVDHDPSGQQVREVTDTSPRHRDNSETTRTDTDTRYRNDKDQPWERGRTWESNWTRTDANGDGVPDAAVDADQDGTPDNAEGEHKGESRTQAQVTLAEGETKLWEKTYASHSVGDEKGDHAKIDFLSTEGKLEGEAAIGRDGVALAGAATAGGYIAKASGQYSTGFGTSAKGEAFVGAEANANAGVALGADGLKAGGGAEAFIGGKAEGQVSQDLGPVDVGVGGEISYGIGAHAEADAEISADNVGVSVDIGATLGLGGGVSFDVGVDPTFWN